MSMIQKLSSSGIRASKCKSRREVLELTKEMSVPKIP
ncbi:hypothetical protein [Bacillus coahuilensis]